MNKTEMDEAFRKFENKYGIPPVYPMIDGDKLGAFIITFKSHDSFMITAESPDVDIQDAASMLDPDNVKEAAKDIRALQKMCSPIETNAVPPTLHYDSSSRKVRIVRLFLCVISVLKTGKPYIPSPVLFFSCCFQTRPLFKISI